MSKFIKLSVSDLYPTDSEATKMKLENPTEIVFNTDCIKVVAFNTRYNQPTIAIEFDDSAHYYLVHYESFHSLYKKLRK